PDVTHLSRKRRRFSPLLPTLDTISSCLGYAFTNIVSHEPTNVIMPKYVNPSRKLPVLLLRYPTISGAKYSTRWPIAFTKPITEPTILEDKVSVGIAQNAPIGP